MTRQKFDYIDFLSEQRGSFDFSLATRNAFIESLGATRPPVHKTGTTICGLLCQNAVVLGADTRATEGSIVADKDADKIHIIADNICCAGAGTSADLRHTTCFIQSNIELHRLATNTQPRVATAVSMLSKMLYQYQGHVSCALVLGGVDVRGPHLYTVHPHGSTDMLPFAAMGSGSLNAMAVLEQGFKDDMTIEEGKSLVIEAIKAGVMNDLGSGGNIDVMIIQKNKKEHLRGVAKLAPRLYPTKPPEFTKTTEYYREKIAAISPLVSTSEPIVSNVDVVMG